MNIIPQNPIRKYDNKTKVYTTKYDTSIILMIYLNLKIKIK
jgi:hypothetical protein